MRNLNQLFSRFSRKVTIYLGSSLAFCIAVLLIILWILAGPVMGFSTDWQLYANTFTTLVNFLLSFLILHANNRSSEESSVKADALIEASEASNRFIGLEEASEEELREITAQFRKARQEAIRETKDTDA